MSNPVSLYDMESMAKLRMDHTSWEYVAGGATDEITLRRNREAFGEIAINPRFLEELTPHELSTTVLGQKIDLPIMAAPTGAQFLAHPDAEVGVARGAGAVGTLTTVATGASHTVEEIARAASGPLWFQLYHLHDDVTEFMVKKAAAAGFSALCLTIDGVGGGPKERDARNNFNPGAERFWADLRERPDLLEKAKWDDRHSRRPTWEKLQWFKSLSSMPLIAKGILTPRDAEKCADRGVDAIVVSNHGARVIDTTLASIEALPAIAEAVGDRVEIYLDSGVRRGTDVLKALALGARAVLVGRPIMWGLAIDGAAGVQTMFEILKGELESVMNFTGVSSIHDIDPSMVTLNWR
ncbi:MAG: alpha-hydroxy acid oxidase [Chloroflexi bacterium]|nr:alpha-hydroxy acid oxidase [Chloroflexota bacterium]